MLSSSKLFLISISSAPSALSATTAPSNAALQAPEPKPSTQLALCKLYGQARCHFNSVTAVGFQRTRTTDFWQIVSGVLDTLNWWNVRTTRDKNTVRRSWRGVKLPDAADNPRFYTDHRQ